MTRFNYLAPAPKLTLPARFTTLAIDNAIRGPLAALLATIVLSAALSAVQLTRLHAAQNAYARASIRLSSDAAALAEVAAVRARVTSEIRLSERVGSIRRASAAHASELIWIGNHLPSQTWLDALRYEAGSYSLEGSANGASAVGWAMLALHDATHPTNPQLISLRDDTNSDAPRVRYRLRLQVFP